MPVPFQPTTIPLVSGVRQDIAKFAATDDPRLVDVENCVFTRKGSIIGRPGAQSREAVTQTAGAGTALGGNLNTVVSGLIPSGICGSLGGGSLGRETALALFQGGAYAYKDTVWQAVGAPWSARITRSVNLSNLRTGSSARVAPIPCGTSVIGVETTVGASSGFPFLNSNGEVSSVGTAADNIDAVGRANISAAGDALFYPTASGTVYGAIPGTPPTTSLVTVGTGCSTTTSQHQTVSATPGESGSYYVAYVSATAGHVVLKRLDSSGTVTATLDVSGLGTVLGCAVCFNGVNKLCLAWIDTTGPTLKTKVFTTAVGSFTDTQTDLSFAGPATTDDTIGYALGLTAAGDASLLYATSSAGIVVTGRLFQAATTTNSMPIVGVISGAAIGIYWTPLFAGQVLGGRTLVGMLRSNGEVVHKAQWVVLDVQPLYVDNSQSKLVVAAGQVEGTEMLSTSVVGRPDANSIAFGVPEGLTFDTGGVATAGITRVTISAQPCASAQAHNLTLLSGGALCAFDGTRARPLGFVEGAPRILETTTMVGSGSLPAGSYSYQCTWEAVNGRGQTVRSGASNEVTLTSSGSQNANVVVTVPQLRDFLTAGDSVRVKLYATQVNPSAGAPLYYVTESVVSTLPVSTQVQLVHVSGVDITGEQLYTGGNVLDDESPPGGDRGVAYAVQRVWVADQRNVYASKLLDPLRAPAWSTAGLHTIPMPASIGQVQALAGLDDKLIVLCTGGVAVVFGAGYDDLGNGTGWSTVVLSHVGVMPGSPRVAATMPDGIAFLGTDGCVWLVTPGGQVQPISRPMRDARVTSALDIAYVPSRQDFSAMLFSLGTTQARVMDAEVGAWGTWNGMSGVSYLGSVNGVLWALTASGSVRVQSYDGTQGQDLGVSFDQVVKTGILRPAGSTSAWGRVRGLTVMEVPSTYTQIVKVYADNLETVIMNKSAQIVPTASAVWPYSQNPQYRTTQQRCQFLSVELRATPGVAEWNAINIWAAGSQEQAPGRTRS